MLTDTRIRNTKPGTKAKKLSDSHGLYLEVTPAGGRLWRYRFRLDGSEKAFVIGKYPEIGRNLLETEWNLVHEPAVVG